MSKPTESSRKFILLRKSYDWRNFGLCRSVAETGPHLMTQEEIIDRIGPEDPNDFVILDISNQKSVLVTRSVV